MVDRSRAGLPRAIRAGAIAVFLALLGAAAGSPAVSPLDRLTPEQRQKLLAGEVVYEYVLSPDPLQQGLGFGCARVIIARSAAESYRVMTNYAAKHFYFPHMKTSQVIKKEGNKTWVHEVLDFTIAEVEYVVIQEETPAAFRVDHYFDRSYPHTIGEGKGWFYFEDIAPGQCLLSYAFTQVDIGVPVPGFIMKALTSRDLPEIVTNTRRRIESNEQWSKK